MDNLIFLVYFLYLMFALWYMLRLALKLRRTHRKYIYTGIAYIVERYKKVEDRDKAILEIEGLYNTCCRFYKDLNEIYPNVVYVLDDIHAVINTKIKSRIVGRKIISIFVNNYEFFEDIHVKLKKKYPYYEYNEKQQLVLKEFDENSNILNRLITEFKLENLKQLKNEKDARNSMIIGIIGIILSAIGILIQ